MIPFSPRPNSPLSEEFQIGRTSVVPGLLKTLASNRAVSVRAGVRLFEVTDVMLLDGAADVGARNERHVAVVYTGPTAGFEVVHGIVDRLFALLEIPARPFSWEAGAAAAANFGKHGLRYAIEPTDAVPSFFPGRGARVVLETAAGARTELGTLGVLHPTVLANFELSFPASVLELNIQPLV
jgi:phenylalanyl-tRNA synthetase beta chain